MKSIFFNERATNIHCQFYTLNKHKSTKNLTLSRKCAKDLFFNSTIVLLFLEIIAYFTLLTFSSKLSPSQCSRTHKMKQCWWRATESFLTMKEVQSDKEGQHPEIQKIDTGSFRTLKNNHSLKSCCVITPWCVWASQPFSSHPEITAVSFRGSDLISFFRLKK